jgi:GT2 family glycosyltransferase
MAAKCSIVIPTFNRSATIQRCLDHLAAQDVGPETLEVIVVDDGSTDDTRTCLAQQPERFASLTVLAQENAGPGAARNLGLAAVSAPIVLFINDDTMLAPDAIRHHLATHHAHPQSMVLGSFMFVDSFLQTPLGQLLTETPLMFSYPLFDDGDTVSAALAATCNLSIDAAFAQHIGFDSWFTFAAEDVDFAMRAEAEGYTLRYCESAASRHEHHLTIDGLKRTVLLRGLGSAQLALKHQRQGSLLSDVRAAHGGRTQLTHFFDESAIMLAEALQDASPSALPDAAYASLAQLFRLGNLLGSLDEPTLVAEALEVASARN